MRRLKRIWRRRPADPAPLELTPDMLASAVLARRKADKETGSDLELLSREVEQVALYVAQLKREVGVLRPSEILLDRFPAVRDDLTHAAETTRTAVDAVMSAVEAIIASDRSAADFATVLDERTTAIIEACSFQDIVGQRLSRAQEALDAIGHRLERFLDEVRIPDATDVYDRDAIVREAKRHVLLVEGPQDGKHAVEQGAIDKMFD